MARPSSVRLTMSMSEVNAMTSEPMTMMVFRVAAPAMLDAVAVGDRVRFDAAKVGGAYTVTALKKM